MVSQDLEKAEILKDFDRSERWALANLMNFNKPNCKVLHLGWNNPKHKYRLGEKWIESSPAEKDLGVWVDQKLSVTWQCVLVAQKSSHILGCIKRTVTIRLTKVIFPACSALMRPHVECCILLWGHNIRRSWTCWNGEDCQRAGSSLL